MAQKKTRKLAKAKKITRKTKPDTVQNFNPNIDEIYKKEAAPDKREEMLASEIVHQRKIDNRKNIRGAQRTAR